MTVKTKIIIPRVRKGLVDRSRLIQLLNEGRGVKLTLLCAPAGYGKTTALSEWANQNGTLTAWVSLDQQDNDWVQFWSCFTASIQKRIPEFGQTLYPFLDQGPSASLMSKEPAIDAMLNELSKLSSELMIIFDDVHLIQLPSIHKSLSYLIEHLPAHIHLYMASRSELPMPTARLLAKGELRRISIQDLCFAPEEGVSFFRDTADLSLSREQVAKLCHQTEGWVSGLQLSAISLKHSDNIAESIHKFSGHQHHIAEYLLEEVFQQQSEEIRTFMLQTSILSRMNHSLCEAVTGQANSQEQLEKLEHAHLFIIPLDDQRNWYRYHHLLSDFLQKIFYQKAPDTWMKTHVQAAKWLESQGFEEEAAEHYLISKHYEDVVRVIENNLNSFIYKKSAVLSRWILQVPESFFSDRPFVELFYLNLMVGVTTQWEHVPVKVEQARIRYEARQAEMNEDEYKEIMGNLYTLSALAAYIQKDMKQVGHYLIKADPYLSANSLTLKLGHNKHFGLEEFDDHLSYINDYHETASFLQRMISHYGPHPNHPFITTMFASYGKLLYEWNRLEEAESCLRKVMVPNNKPLIPRISFHVFIAAARVQQGMGNPARAQELIEQLKLQIDSPDYEVFMRKIEAEQAWLYVQQGDIDYGLKWLEQSGLESSDEPTPDSVFEHLVLAKVLAACGRRAEALALSEKLYKLLVIENRLRDRIKILILQSLLLYLNAQKEKAFLRLESALSLAQPEGFIRSFIDEGSVLAELLSDYLQSNQPSSDLVDYAHGLLHAYGNLKPLPDKIIRAQVYCFGLFQVVRQKDREILKWRTSKTAELMAYLIHQRGKPVSRDQILDSLWSDVDIERAINQFNTTVYYLRKNLSTFGIEGIIQHVRGHYIIQMSRLDCDIDAFHQLVSAGIPIDSESIKQCEEKLENIYQTGYFQIDYYSWADQARILLDSEYTRMMLQIYEHYVQEREYSSAVDLMKKIMVSHPFNEDFHAKLIKVYLLAGDRLSAKRQYNVLKEMLETELGVEPAESVKQLLQ